MQASVRNMGCAIVLGITALCGCGRQEHTAAEPQAREPGSLSAVINRMCPRSGRPVAADSLTHYRGHVVGFCNPHCRHDFAAHAAARPRDRAAFDAIIDASNE